MKKFLALLLVTLLSTAILAGCGTNQEGDDQLTDNGASNSAGETVPHTSDGTVNPDMDENGVQKNATGARINGATGRTAGMAGAAGTYHSSSDRTGAGRTTTGIAARKSDRTKGVTYEQMLRNAYVHDRDGNLYDRENAVTPGAAY